MSAAFTCRLIWMSASCSSRSTRRAHTSRVRFCSRPRASRRCTSRTSTYSTKVHSRSEISDTPGVNTRLGPSSIPRASSPTARMLGSCARRTLAKALWPRSCTGQAPQNRILRSSQVMPGNLASSTVQPSSPKACRTLVERTRTLPASMSSSRTRTQILGSAPMAGRISGPNCQTWSQRTSVSSLPTTQSSHPHPPSSVEHAQSARVCTTLIGRATHQGAHAARPPAQAASPRQTRSRPPRRRPPRGPAAPARLPTRAPWSTPPQRSGW